jgi:translation initiation factor IF-2
VATVRIYKVAELLNTTSQEVMALLKRDHGIDVKSASSTIEEVVARSFVERLGRQRGITVPPASAMFSDAPAARAGRKPGGARAPEPPKPAAPPLPPPRLIKTIRPYPQPEGEGAAEGTPGLAAAPMAAGLAGVEAEVRPAYAPAPEAQTGPAGEPVAEAAPVGVVEAAPVGVAGEPAEIPGGTDESHTPFVTEVAVQEPMAEAEPGAITAAAAATTPPQGAPTAPTGRLIPPTLRLRFEDPSVPTVEGPARTVARVARPAAPAPPPPRPAAPPPPAGASTGVPITARAPLGGPRPVPTQPVRPGLPSGIRSPLTQVPRPSYSPTGYVAPSRPAGTPGLPARPTGPARPATGPAGPRPRPAARPHGRRTHDTREGYSAPAPAPAGPPPVTRSITLAEGMTVKDLADKLEVKVKDVLKRLLEKRVMLTINSTLDTETATSIAREFGADVEMRTFEEEVVEAETGASRPEDVVGRAPVVTVMGHVDHGKTTLLDAIRQARVAEHEAGGITQHIGAYTVDVNKRKVVFLDTPGHEAFTMMRARGAKVTDVVILVVAADDGVMPQTREAINHARAANVPLIVAINKIDKPDANPDRVKKELADLGLVPEEWGGQTVTVAVSAKKRQNLDLLLEMILLVTEIAELKANPKRASTGTVLEAKLDRGRGPVATVLVQDGTLHVGDNFIAGTVVGKVRALIDDRGRAVKHAPPSTPVEVLGLPGLPQPGDTFQTVEDAAKARQIAMFRLNQARERAQATRQPRLTLESLRKQIAEEGVKELPVVIKADVQGSAEVLGDTLTKLSDEKVKILVVHAGVGAINESDVLLASASNAIVIGFNVRPDRNAADIAEREKVDVRLHSVIYNVTDEIKKAMTGLLEPTLKEVRLGAAEVRQLFKVPKFGTVAGCMVTDGVIRRSGEAQARLLRDNVVVFEGRLGSLRRFKDDVSEVKTGFECGIAFERFNDLKVGDVIEAFVVERVEAQAS